MVAIFAGILVGPYAVARGQQSNLGTASIGTTSSASPVTLTFTVSGTLSSISVVTQGAGSLDFANAGGGSCTTATSYNTGDTCTVNVTLTPEFAGSRYGAVVLADGSANVIGTTSLLGSGTGPQTSFLPGTETTVTTSSLNTPAGLQADGSGDVYLVDANNNRVLKETFAAGGYTESTVPTSTLSGPSDLAVDGSGNVYITDTFNNRVLKETLSGSTYTESTVPTSTLNEPYGIATDAAGDVFIADYGNNRVIEEAYSLGIYTESTITTGALNGPGALVVDGSGNLYIADYGNNRILKETPAGSSYTETTVPTSTLSSPGALAVDGSGNLYIADTFNYRILKETPAAGSYTESTVSSSTLSYPYGVGVDGSGNVYIADSFNNRMLKEDLADAPSLSFAATSVNSISSDSPRTVTVSNYGNASLSFSAVSYPTDFPENGTPTGDCTASTVLASTASCTLTINFAPITPLVGSSAQLTEDVVVTTNTLNAAVTQQSVIATGTETP